MKSAGRLAENTRLAYRDVIDRLILPKLGETPMRDVRADVLASSSKSARFAVCRLSTLVRCSIRCSALRWRGSGVPRIRSAA
ncbi:hypothetical protein ABRP24_001280 [Curtobacterium sp. WHRI 8282]|uniref:hypothetical protein n=1 Tax=Curtobacterium sp. WHRI 8282 TaxID=3162559 RepID=UPI003531546A